MEILGKTKVVGIIGNPVSHSASPAMHNVLYQLLGLDYVYVPFFVENDQVEAAVAAVRALHLVGVNVTVPHKQSVIGYLDEVDPFAQKVGAVNTVVNKQGKLIGYNTDGPGFILSLQEEAQLNVKNKRVLVIGAGGSARAICFSVLEFGASRLTILNRTREKADILISQLQSHFDVPIQFGGAMDLADSDLVVNTTSVGMASQIDLLPLNDLSWMSETQLIYDIIYAPSKTTFLQKAEESGAKILNGTGMLIGQGILAFEYFTGHVVTFSQMRAAFNHN